MKHREFSWNSSDKFKIYSQVWEPEESPKAVITLIHGLGEHSGRYNHWAKKFVENDFAVVTMDLRCHGKSQGSRGGVSVYNQLLNDIDQLIAETEKLYPEKPIFLYGHSLGGLLTINYTLRRKPFIKAIIATSPGLKMVEPPHKALYYLALGIRPFLPFLTMNSQLNPNHISRNKEEVDKYVADPLVHNKASVELFIGSFAAGEWSLLHAREFHLPLLILHGSGDKICSHEASESFANKTKDISEIKIYEGAYHELHNEDIKDEVFAYIKDWTEKVLTKVEKEDEA